MLYKPFLLFAVMMIAFLGDVVAQKPPQDYGDDESAELLKKVAAKYEAYSTIKADFQLLSIQPKVHATDNEAKLTDTIKGSIAIKGAKFKIVMQGQEIYCDGRNLWTYSIADKEVQVSLFEESDEVFSPSKIFSFYKTGYSRQMKERKTFKGKKVAVVELSPVNRKVSYFKIDAGFDETSYNLLEAKVYGKNGMRYIYQIVKERVNEALSDDFFVFDTKKHPSIRVEDLR